MIPNITTTPSRAGFSLPELMVAMLVLSVLVVLFAQVVRHTSLTTHIGNRRVDSDTQARVVLDRLSADISRMLKRTDVDYYVKQPTGYNGHSNGHAYGKKVTTGQLGSDQIAFFAQTQGYYPSGFNTTDQGPVSLISYRVNEDTTQRAYLRLERMSKGLLWNGVVNNSNLNNSGTKLPLVFLPQTIAGMNKPWYAAVNNDANTFSQDNDYEIIAPDVFRFEYYYLLKNGEVKDTPWDTSARTLQRSLSTAVLSGTTTTVWSPIGLQDVQAIAVAIAVIDRADRLLANATDPNGLYDLASDLADFANARGNGNPAQKIGDMEDSWNTSLATTVSSGMTSTGSRVPASVAAGVRVYCRYIDIGWN